MAKMTREEKKAKAEAEQLAERTARYRDTFRAERAKLVVRGPDEAFTLAMADRPDGGGLSRTEAELVYSALYRVQYAWRSFNQATRWLASAVEDAARYGAQQRVYGSSLVGSRGSDLDAAGAALQAATEAARELCRSFKVYSPLLYEHEHDSRRNERLRLDVAQDVGVWRLTRDGVPLTIESTMGDIKSGHPLGSVPLAYETEDAAWRALAAVLNERVS